MDNEPANFVKAVEAFKQVLSGHPVAKFIEGGASEYTKELHSPAKLDPFFGCGTSPLPFSGKRLLDVFLYTQYAHQPDERRTRQFHECLAAVGGDRTRLTWMFLNTIWRCAIHIRNAGVYIAELQKRYCDARKIASGVLTSVHQDHPGFGCLEKKDAQEARVLQEAAESLAKALWERAGRPEGGHSPFVDSARHQLQATLKQGDPPNT
jgi:hypothetical protein